MHTTTIVNDSSNLMKRTHVGSPILSCLVPHVDFVSLSRGIVAVILMCFDSKNHRFDAFEFTALIPFPTSSVLLMIRHLIAMYISIFSFKF